MAKPHTYEVGLIRNELDNATEKFYGHTTWDREKLNKTDEEIEQRIENDKEQIEAWKKNKKQLSQMYKAGKSLEDIFEWEVNWDWLRDKVSSILLGDEDRIWQPKDIRDFLKGNKNWSDDDIWQALIEICDERVKNHEE